MGFRFRNFSPYGPEEGLNGWIHLLKGWQRHLFGLPSDRFLDRSLGQGRTVAPVSSDSSKARCHLCGYAMISLLDNDGWVIQTCSSMMPNKALDNGSFARWRAQLPKAELSPPMVLDENKAEPTHLQTTSY